MTETNWVNNKVPIWKHIVRPCHLCKFCPYGGIVEMFPLQGSEDRRGDMSCEVFGHDCPAYYNAETIREDSNQKKDYRNWEMFMAEVSGHVDKAEG